MEGNLNLTFAVDKKRILDKIATNSFYRGERVKDENGAHAARMQSGNDNTDVLQDELELAVADVVTIITRNLGRCSAEENKYLQVVVNGETWELSPKEDSPEGNYIRKSDNAQVYIQGDIAVDNSVTVRDVAAGSNYSGIIKSLPGYLFNVLAASNFPDILKLSVEGAITSYMFDKALEGWMLINMPGEVQALGQRSAADAEKLRQLLVERSKPIR